MKYHVFHATTGQQVAITDDRTGAKLPKRKAGSWAYKRDVDVSPGGGARIGADSDAIIDGITRDGYYIWPKRDA